MKPIRTITIRRRPSADPASGLLETEGRTWPCLLGRNGISARKCEGDWKTPSGSFPLLYGFYRADRIRPPHASLPLFPIADHDGWCDQSGDRNYNRPITLPYPASCETMKRDDGLYDIVLVMDHNYRKRMQGAGSAVFFHLTAEKNYTAGCIAIEQDLMMQLLPRLASSTVMQILP